MHEQGTFGVYKRYNRWGPLTEFGKKAGTVKLEKPQSNKEGPKTTAGDDEDSGYYGVEPVVGCLPIGSIVKSSTTDFMKNQFQPRNQPKMVNMDSGVRKFLNLNKKANSEDETSPLQNQQCLQKSSSADNAALWSKFKLNNSRNMNNLILEKNNSYTSIPQEQKLNNVGQMAQHFMKLENAQRYRQPLKTVHNQLGAENLKETNTSNSNGPTSLTSTPEFLSKQGGLKSLKPKLNDCIQPCVEPSKLTLKERIKLFNEYNSGSEQGSQEKLPFESKASFNEQGLDQPLSNPIGIPRNVKVRSFIMSRSADDLSEGEYSSGGQEVNEIISKSYENSPIASRKKSWSSKPSFSYNMRANPSSTVNNGTRGFFPNSQLEGRNHFSNMSRTVNARPTTTSNLLPVLTALSSSDEAIPDKTYRHFSLRIGTARL